MNEESRKKLEKESPTELIERISRYVGMIQNYRRKIEASEDQINQLSKRNEELSTKVTQQSQSIDLLSSEKEAVSIRNAKLEVRLKQFLHEKKESAKNAIANMTDFDAQQEIYKLQQENRQLRQLVKSKDDQLSQFTTDSSFVDPYSLDPIQLGGLNSTPKPTAKRAQSGAKLDEDAVGAATQLITNVAKDLNSWWFGGSQEQQDSTTTKQTSQTPSKLESASARRQQERHSGSKTDSFSSPQHHISDSSQTTNQSQLHNQQYDVVSLQTPAKPDQTNNMAYVSTPSQYNSLAGYSDIFAGASTNKNDDDDGDDQHPILPSVQFNALLDDDNQHNQSTSTFALGSDHQQPPSRDSFATSTQSKQTAVIDLFDAFGAVGSPTQTTSQTHPSTHPPSDTENEFSSLQERFHAVERDLQQLTSEIDDLRSNHNVELSDLKQNYEAQLTHFSSSHSQTNQQYDDLIMKYNKLNETCNNLQQSYTDLQTTYSQLQTDHSTLITESKILNATLSDAESQIIHLQQQSNSHALSSSHQFDDLTHQYSQLQQDFNKVQLEVNTLQSQNNTLEQKYQQALSTHKTQYNQLQTLYRSAQDKSSLLESQLEQIQQQRDQFSRYVDDLRKQLKESDDGEISGAADLLSQHHDEVEQITAQLTTSYESKLTQLRSELKIAQVAAAEEFSQNDKMKSERIQALEEELDQMKTKLDQAQTPLQQALDNLSQLYARHEELEAEKVTIILERDNFESINTFMKTQLHTLEIEHHAVQEKLSQMIEKDKNSTSLFGQLSKSNEALELEAQKCVKLEQINVELEDKITQLQLSLQSLQSHSQQSDQATSQLQGKCTTLEQTIVQLETSQREIEAQRDDLQQQLAAVQDQQSQTRAQLESQLKSVEAQYTKRIETLNYQSDILQTDYQELQQELEHVKAECESLRGELDTLHAENITSTAQHTQLQDTLSQQLHNVTELYKVLQEEQQLSYKANKALREELTEVDDKLFQLQSQSKQSLETSQNTIHSLQQELSMVNVEHDGVKQELIQLNDTFNQLQSEFIALKTDSCKSQELAKQHEDTIETLTNEKKAITDQLADLQAKLTEIEENFNNLGNDYAELKSNVTNLTTTDLALLQASVSRYIISNGDDHQFLFPSICTILGLNSQDLTRQRDEYKRSHTTVLQSATSAATWSSWMTVGSEFLNSTIQNLQQQNDTVINSSSPTAAVPASPRQGQ